MANRKRHQKRKQPEPEDDLVVKITDFHPPVPVQPGDQVTTRFTEDGPLITRITRDGKQIWPELQPSA